MVVIVVLITSAAFVLCRYGMTLIERCYDNIDAIETEAVTSTVYADVVIDISTCVLLRDVSLLSDAHQSQQLALRISSLASKYLRCCVVVAPRHQTTCTE